MSAATMPGISQMSNTATASATSPERPICGRRGLERGMATSGQTENAIPAHQRRR